MSATGMNCDTGRLAGLYEVCGKYQDAHLTLCRQLIERIAALTAERDELRAQVKFTDYVLELEEPRKARQG